MCVCVCVCVCVYVGGGVRVSTCFRACGCECVSVFVHVIAQCILGRTTCMSTYYILHMHNHTLLKVKCFVWWNTSPAKVTRADIYTGNRVQ